MERRTQHDDPDDPVSRLRGHARSGGQRIPASGRAWYLCRGRLPRPLPRVLLGARGHDRSTVMHGRSQPGALSPRCTERLSARALKTQVTLRDRLASQPPSSAGRAHSCRLTTWAWPRSRAVPVAVHPVRGTQKRAHAALFVVALSRGPRLQFRFPAGWFRKIRGHFRLLHRGHCEAHSSVTYGYRVVAPGSGRVSCRSSVSKPQPRSSRIMSPGPRCNSPD